MVHASVCRANSSLTFRDVAPRVRPREVFAELSDHAAAIVLGPGAKVAEALLVGVGDLPREPWLRHSLLVQKTVKISQ
jgi:hypothetical protein